MITLKKTAALHVLLVSFTSLFDRRVWDHVVVLVCGTLLARGQRTVTSALRALGLHNVPFHRYHRVLSARRWSSWRVSRRLLELIITPQWQLATRYQLAGSNKDQGLSAQKRCEKPSGIANGDLYQAGYVGVNYYIAKHRLKLMTGVEYSNMSGQEAWTASTMLRMYWGPHGSTPFPTNMVLPLETD